MKLNIVSKRDAPEPPYECELVSFRPQAAPFVLGSLWLRAQKYWWSNDANAQTGRRLMALVGSELLMPCGKDIVDALDRLYRLQDSIHNGTSYGVTGDGSPGDPYVYTPAIPLVPTPQDGAQPSTLFYLAKAMRLQDNLVNGTTYVDAPDARNLRQQLEDILAAIQSGGYDDTEVQELLDLILLALA